MKVIVIGEPGVGKTSLIRRISTNKFDTSYLLTIGMDPTEIILKDEQNREQRIMLWDIAGQERFRTFREAFYKGANAAIGVFDLTRPDSLRKLTNWINEYKKFIFEEIPLILLGNKVDLEDYISIEDETIHNFIKEHNASFYSTTSAKTGSNVVESFRHVL